MAVKTFTQGEVATAADTNTYLANSGLVYVTEASFSNSAAVTLDNCFPAAASGYVIRYYQTSCTSNANLEFYYRTSGTDITASYFWALWYVGSTGGSGIENGHSVGSGRLSTIGSAAPDHIATIELQNNIRHVANIRSGGFQSGTRAFRHGGVMNDNNATVTGIKIFPTAGTITGKVIVYEVRGA